MRKKTFGAKVIGALCSLALVAGLCPAVALAADEAIEAAADEAIIEVAEDADLEDLAYDADSKYTAELKASGQALNGKTFDVVLNVKTSDASAAPMSCMQVTVKYDTKKVSLGEDNIAINSGLERGDCTDNGKGTAIITFYGNTAASIDAATLTFTAKKVGDAGIGITDAIAGASGQLDDKGVKYNQDGAGINILFPDVTDSSKFYYGSVYQAVNLGIINGYSDGTFGPTDNLTRAQAAVIIWSAYGKPNSTDKTNHTGMDDVKSGAYYTAAANWCVENGVISGKGKAGNLRFDPEGMITRQELCAIVANTASKLNGINIKNADRTKLNAMDDADQVASWAQNPVAWCLNNGVISGKGGSKVAPTVNVTRGEIATIVVKAINKGYIGIQ